MENSPPVGGKKKAGESWRTMQKWSSASSFLGRETIGRFLPSSFIDRLLKNYRWKKEELYGWSSEVVYGNDSYCDLYGSLEDLIFNF